jgi:hypothetical protein
MATRDKTNPAPTLPAEEPAAVREGREFAAILDISAGGKRIAVKDLKDGGAFDIALPRHLRFHGEADKALEILARAFEGCTFRWAEGQPQA